MSWLSSFWHNDIERPIGHFISNTVNAVENLFKPPDTSAQTAAIQSSIATQTAAVQAQTDALKAQTAQAAQAAADALDEQRKATLTAAAAATPPSDSESARAAADNRRRQLQQGSIWNVGLPTTTGAPPVGYRMLAGQ